MHFTGDATILVMASVATTKGQEVVECDLCQNPVSFFCRRCGVNLCDACIPVHLRVKSKTGHDVVDYVSKDNEDTCFCDSHPKHECSAFCKTCNAPICMLCVSIKHKSHEISELSDKIEALLQSITRETDRLQSFRHVLEKKLNDTTKQLSSLSSVYQKGKNDVTAQGVKWHKLIDKHVKKLHQELDDLKNENEAVLQNQKQKFEEMIEKMDEINRKSTHIQKSKNVREMQKFKSVIKKQKTIEQFTQYIFPVFHDCKLDENNIETLFGFIGKIQEKKIPLLEISDMKMLEVPLLSAVMDTGFPSHKDDKNRLYDMAVTDDKKIWMGGESKELKLFDFQGNLHRTVTITYPRGAFICMYNKQVVFSDPSDNTVKKVSEEGTLVTMFQTGHWEPNGITGSASGDLLTCLIKDDQSKVVRYSSTGTVLQEIQFDSQGQPFYQYAFRVAENVNGDIIVIDFTEKIVIVVDRLGIFRYSYSREDKRSFSPSAVTTDSVGQWFVTDFYSKKIHMLDRDGQFLRYIIPKGGIKHPCAVCMIGSGEIIVGECKTGLVKRIKYLDK